MATEQLGYSVVERHGDLEIRQVAPHIVAETTVSGRFEWVGNVAFQRLAGYIFGKNRRRTSVAMTAPVLQEPAGQSIPMTAPVLQEPASERIAMTAPVSQEGAGKSWVVTFVMPSQYTLETLPEPLDPNVTLRERPGQLMAALTYSGSWRRATFEKKRRQLETLIAAHGYEPVGPAVFARYDAPMTLYFRRRNEVLIPVRWAGADRDTQEH